MTVVCVGARFLTVIKELYFAYRSFFFSLDCSVCPHCSWEFCGVELEKGV